MNALLNLSAPDVSSAVAPADYTGNGNVRLLGHVDVQPPNPYYGDNSTTGMLYNGIWGYATGAREYALQCNSTGLHIIDVTDPLAPYRVQFINMSGGLNPPKGRIWRDVDIYTDPCRARPTRTSVPNRTAICGSWTCRSCRVRLRTAPTPTRYPRQLSPTAAGPITAIRYR